jgi:predicted naringenin-chalcone synthase
MEQPACYVHGIGLAVPTKHLDAEACADLLQQTCRNPHTARLLRRIVKLTGIEKRHLAALDYQFDAEGKNQFYLDAAEQPNGPRMGARNGLFERASRPLVQQALSDLPAGILPGIDALVTCSCTHASAPGLERHVLMDSPVSPGVDRWNLGFMGCSAGLAGLRLAYSTAARRKQFLIVACELSSLHFQYSDEIDQVTANLLFADGAAAMVVSPEPSAVGVVDCRCVGLPEHADQMVWFADDHGLRLDLSQDLPDTLAEYLPKEVDRFLSDNELSAGDVDHWLVHPGGPQILDSVEQSLNLPKDALESSRNVLRQYGNMSSPTILFIMRELFGRKCDGMCVAIAFGPGLTIEIALLQIRRNGN